MKLDRQEVLAGKSLLLLDFDGPVCGVFAGLPAADVAAELVADLYRSSPSLAGALEGETDPMRVLNVTEQEGPRKAVKRLDQLLCRAEVRAVASAEPTAGVAELIKATRLEGKAVAIVSNNCHRAIATYLRLRGLDPYLSVVVGRPLGRPKQMKPDPYLIRQALGFTVVDPSKACFIGDSVTDMEAGKAAGVTTVGFANRPGKARSLKDAGASLVVTEL